MIEKLKKEAEKVCIIGIAFALLALIQLGVAFDSCIWLMFGFLAWCCFTYARGNLRAIEYYENQNEKHKLHEKQIMEA